MTIVFLPNWYHSFTNILLKAKAKFTYQRKPTCSLFFIGASRCYSHPSAKHKVVNAKNVVLLCNEATKKQTSSIIVFFRCSAQIQTIIFKADSACILRNLWAEIMSWVFVQPGKFFLDGATNSSVDWTFRLPQDLFVDHKTYLLTINNTKRKFIQGVLLHKPMARVFKRSKSLELHNFLYHALTKFRRVLFLSFHDFCNPLHLQTCFQWSGMLNFYQSFIVSLKHHIGKVSSLVWQAFTPNLPKLNDIWYHTEKVEYIKAGTEFKGGTCPHNFWTGG